MSLNTVGNISSIVSLAISIITLLVAIFVNKKVNELQNRNLFNKTIDKHLRIINKLQKELISFLPYIVSDEIRIKEILVELLTEFESISPLLQNRAATHKMNCLIRKIRENLRKKYSIIQLRQK